MLRRGVLKLCEVIPENKVALSRKRSMRPPLVCKQSVSTYMPEDELADLISTADSSKTLSESQWVDGDFSRSSCIFPSPLIETARSEPIAAKNADRLAQLWSVSNSHGISWDELDEAFLSFHQEYLKAESDWLANYDSRWEEQYKHCEESLRKTLSGEEADIALTMNRRRGKIRRMTYTRLARLRNKEILQRFGLPEFSSYMKQLVSQRIVKREESERSL